MSQHAELIAALTELADAIERSPPPIVASDIRVHAKSGRAVGQEINLTATGSGGSATGQRITVVADRPGQTVYGMRINVTAGGHFDPSTEPALPSSNEEIDAVVGQIRVAVQSLTVSSSSKTWIKSLIGQVEKWGQPALSGAVSGAAGALMKSALGA